MSDDELNKRALLATKRVFDATGKAVKNQIEGASGEFGVAIRLLVANIVREVLREVSNDGM